MSEFCITNWEYVTFNLHWTIYTPGAEATVWFWINKKKKGHASNNKPERQWLSNDNLDLNFNNKFLNMISNDKIQGVFVDSN